MHPEIVRPQRIEDLDRLLAQSSDRPLLLFKHSLTCGTSAEALDELVDHLNEDKLDARYAIVTVQSHRELSNAVSSRLGIRHETPQALLIRHGRVIWSASHFRVTAAAVQSAIRSHAVDVHVRLKPDTTTRGGQ
jgi:monothiol bacilliredoxin